MGLASQLGDAAENPARETGRHLFETKPAEQELELA